LHGAVVAVGSQLAGGADESLDADPRRDKGAFMTSVAPGSERLTDV
jgi:hypothetical protein